MNAFSPLSPPLEKERGWVEVSSLPRVPLALLASAIRKGVPLPRRQHPALGSGGTAPREVLPFGELSEQITGNC